LIWLTMRHLLNYGRASMKEFSQLFEGFIPKQVIFDPFEGNKSVCFG